MIYFFFTENTSIMRVKLIMKIVEKNLKMNIDSKRLYELELS